MTLENPDTIHFSPSADPAKSKESGEMFTRLIVSNQRRIYGFIRALVMEKAAAEDLLQDVCATAWQKFEDFDPETDFAVWVMSIARFKILNWRRTRKKLPLNLDQENFDLFVDQAIAVNCQFDLRRDALNGCLQELNERHQNLLAQRYQQGQSVSQIAEKKNQSRVAVHRQLARIHSALLQCIERKIQAVS